MSSLLISTMVVLVTVQIGYGQLFKLFSSSRTGDHASCFLACAPQPNESHGPLEEAVMALDQGNATDSQIELVLADGCSERNRTLACLEEAARNCTPGMMPFFSGQRKFYKSFCDDPQRNKHFKNIRAKACATKVEIRRLIDESMNELGALTPEQDEIMYHNATATASLLCAVTGKVREKAQGKNITEQCGSDTAASYNFMFDKANDAFCLSGNADNGVSTVTFGLSTFLLVSAAFLLSKNQD